MKKIKIAILCVCIAVTIIHFYLKCCDVINCTSPTYDEPVHVIEGYSYLKTGSMRIVHPHDHPMLAKIISSLGLFFLNPQPILYTTHPTWMYPQRYAFSNLVLYNNIISAEKILNSARKVIVIISTIFSILLFLISVVTYGILSGVYIVALYTFNPTILSHSCLATQDLLVSVFYFFSIYTFYLWLKTNLDSKTKTYSSTIIYSAIYPGVFLGLALVTKYSAVSIIPTWLLIQIFLIVRKKLTVKSAILFWIISFACCLIIISFVYKIVYIDVYFSSMYEVIKDMQEGRPSFFIGKHSTTGFREYFLIAFLLKTEIGLIILLLLSLIVMFYNLVKRSYGLLEIILAISILIYFVLASFSRMQIGHRHLLPIYPLIFLFTCSLLKSKKIFIILTFLCLGVNIFSSYKNHPWYLSYFNEFIGGSKNGYKYFTDSNIDWGQGLKELGKWLDRHQDIKSKGIYLSYFGVGDPHYYGIKYTPIGFVTNLPLEDRIGDNIVRNKYDRIIIAVSVTNLQCTYYAEKDIFDFLKSISPIAYIADSILVYDITKNREAIKGFLQLLKRMGRREDIEYVKSKFLLKS